MQVDQPRPVIGPRRATRGIVRRTEYRGNPVLFRRQLARLSKVHNFKRTYNAGTFVTSTAGDTLEAFNFSLNDIPGYTEFTALYDFYKINAVKFHFIPFQTESVSTTTVNNAGSYPIFHCVDYSDGTPPASLNEILEYQNHKISKLYEGFTRYFKPKFADTVSTERDGYIATTSPANNWFGMKIGIPATDSAMTYYVLWTIYLSFKDPK